MWLWLSNIDKPAQLQWPEEEPPNACGGGGGAGGVPSAC